MHHATSATTATTTAIPTFLSLLETIAPWSDGHPYAVLMPPLRHLRSAIKVLNDYALHHSRVDDDPTYTHMVNVIESVSSMANRACEHAGDLETKIIADLKQLKAFAAQYGEEV